jgi:hypothetical protein
MNENTDTSTARPDLGHLEALAAEAEAVYLEARSARDAARIAYRDATFKAAVLAQKHRDARGAVRREFLRLARAATEASTTPEVIADYRAKSRDARAERERAAVVHREACNVHSRWRSDTMEDNREARAAVREERKS